ncbi:unnamed protein product [Didymodactylos carnosus]|uniref:NAD(P)(+)--arginine ADP-ribosyltransferase n=1 Tax=Didymodactylos carnosus TaxID=1234261 RepID=A0A8S2KZJ3_9BILA|nr:unnamed protein product [Didymodactylos carnosus]CAF3878542.1 unnamed protein product [Didymodactylos carnosus]
MAEGAKIGKEKEAQWLAQRLLEAKHFSENKIIIHNTETGPKEIGETCIYLYTKESFWYKLLNSLLRNYQTITREQVKTVGPFCWLLERYTVGNMNDVLTVYRGLTVTDEERKNFMKGRVKFTAFTSTSRDRRLAEIFGNTLLIFDLDAKYLWDDSRNIQCAMDVSAISDFPNEEEFTIIPGQCFDVVRHEFDDNTKKYIIYLKVTNYAV